MCLPMSQVRPELVSIGQSARKAALSVPLLGWFARTPAEDEAIQRDAARRRGRQLGGRTASPPQPPPPGTPSATRSVEVLLTGQLSILAPQANCTFAYLE